MEENKSLDKKSLSFLKGRQTDWNELAKDCVAFANAQGGEILIGIEDSSTEPPKEQKIKDKNLPETIQKNIVQRTVNVAVAIIIVEADSGGQYIRVQVFRNAQTIASTTDGRYYIRISDECKPIPPDEMARLAADKNAFVWEEQTTKKVDHNSADIHKKTTFLKDIRTSDRVSVLKSMLDESKIYATGKLRWKKYSID